MLGGVNCFVGFCSQTMLQMCREQRHMFAQIFNSVGYLVFNELPHLLNFLSGSVKAFKLNPLLIIRNPGLYPVLFQEV